MPRSVRSVLSWEYDLYTPAELRRMPISQVKREYTKLRDIVRKRFDRMMASPKYKNHPSVQGYKAVGGIKKLRDIGSREELDRRLTWLAWEVEEGDSSIQRLEDEERRAREVTDAYMGSNDTGSDGSEVSDEDRGKFWQWIKSKYDNAYLPPSDVTDDMITDLLDRSSSEHGRKVIFGQWRSNKRREGEYKYVRA